MANRTSTDTDILSLMHYANCTTTRPLRAQTTTVVIIIEKLRQIGTVLVGHFLVVPRRRQHFLPKQRTISIVNLPHQLKAIPLVVLVVVLLVLSVIVVVGDGIIFGRNEGNNDG